MRTLGDEQYGESDLLRTLWADLAELPLVSPIWVGHRVADFDLKFLYHRSVIHQVRPSYPIGPDIKPWSPYVRDTSFMWTGDARNGISLDRLANALGLANPKELFDGSQVWDLVRDGEYEALVEYNQRDVLTVKDIYRRLAFL